MTRTAPAVPAQAVTRGMQKWHPHLHRSASRVRAANDKPVTYKPDFGSISREEMRKIVAEMIG